ncbi:YfiT family bacillithiol transferase [Paenibacillus sacheonensis]|uniref:Putative metal-dependent hydrolase GT003_22630 n=1 Tax=Paenibacillus sacheonensis TaxID=742054 RepID=A0A7X4YSL9_9BACL|nr:bacillithiol transferase BstA [Paenibacillus sacheonensis]NBC71801.1 bacillithiol transferase BstA [Paenibacillus sacheonensis]
MEVLKYPIGRFAAPAEMTDAVRARWIEEIAALPALLKDAVSGLSEAQLDTPYRDGGWTVRQVVHHLADSHINSYMRFKLALTEEKPTIKPYDEERWAELPDSVGTPVELSLDLVESLHARWVKLLASLSETEYKRAFVHPESGRETPLDRNLGIYAWHGKHHLAHITELKKRMGW